jgi:hypothetical protein
VVTKAALRLQLQLAESQGQAAELRGANQELAEKAAEAEKALRGKEDAAASLDDRIDLVLPRCFAPAPLIHHAVLATGGAEHATVQAVEANYSGNWNAIGGLGGAYHLSQPM